MPVLGPPISFSSVVTPLYSSRSALLIATLSGILISYSYQLFLSPYYTEAT